MKYGILLAGGTGSRLQPFTNYVSKHLLNVNAKPIIEYPIYTLKNMGVENLTIVVGSSFSGQILDYVQDGSRYEMNITYSYQPSPKGIAHAVNLCRRQMAGAGKFAVCLGDNIFEKPVIWQNEYDYYDWNPPKAEIVLNKHPELNRFGVASIKDGEIHKIEEKPSQLDNSFDNYAITGCYAFTEEFFEYFEMIKPSPRGEFEICDIINLYHIYNKLDWTVIDGLWSDVGTHKSIAYVNDYFFQMKGED